ncbi:MAG: acylphosphatase [Actinomycetota bacterium]|nr:acylphosphatase [Actinomycetota bacterium]
MVNAFGRGDEHVRARVLISGRVQGVFFRQQTATRARSRRVSGWVKNLRDGRVEAVFEGDKEAVESIVDWCRRGPPHAVVEKVEVEWGPPSRETDFEIRWL